MEDSEKNKDSSSDEPTTTTTSGVVTDAQESSLGIRTYLSLSSSGFLGVSKARYSDFLVREVNLSGEVACLTDLSDSVPNAENNNETNDSEDPQAGQKRKTPADDTSTVDWVSLQKELVDLVGRTCTLNSGSDPNNKQPTTVDEWAERILSFGKTTTGNTDEKYLGIPLIPSAAKADRKAWHDVVRSSPLSANLSTDTYKEESKDDSTSDVYEIRLWHKDFEKEMPNFGKFDPRNRQGKHKKYKAPKDKEFLRFVLYKENIDTGAALQQLQRSCGFGGGGGRGGRGRGGRGGRHNQQRLRIGHAGMKDKRGVTCQFVTVPSSTPTFSILRANQSRTSGGGHTQSGGAALLRVGNFSFVKDDLRLGRLKGNRFNIVLRNLQLGQSESTYGDLRTILQQNVDTAATDLSTFGFINYFGMQRFGAFQDTHLTGIAVFQKNFQKAVDTILEPKKRERDNIREAREAWAKRFDAIEEDDKDNRAKAEQEAAERLLKECGRFMHNEKLLCQALASRTLDYYRAYACINKTMRMMFVHAVQSYCWNYLATYRIEHFLKDQGQEGAIVGDLVLVDDTALPEESTNDEGTLPEVHVVTEDDVAKSKYTLDQVVLPLVGTSTVMPLYGESILSNLLKKHGLTVQDIKNFSDKNFSCNGSYRKLICRPQDVAYELMEYSDPLEPLLQTDLMKLDGIELQCKRQDTKRLKEGGDAAETKVDKLFGMRVEFTLPSSAYATIALRELMKRPTSSDFQGALKLHNDEGATQKAVEQIVEP